ncbi:MAG: hypothetical protein KDI88_16285 [Gammaproteobacteria bacterium]|nr:hypothetical protein [Gammaproteobacteria bacterium]
MEMDRAPKCPKCSSVIAKESDAIPKEKWPTESWRIYQCSNCGALLEEDNRNLVYRGVEIILALTLTVGVLNALVFWLSGSQTLANIFGWFAYGGWMFWYVTKPVRLAERGQYAKRP